MLLCSGLFIWSECNLGDGDRRKRKTTGKNSRDTIVAAAVRVLGDADRTFDARTIAKEAGKSLGTLSFHFREGGLRELQGESARIGFQRLLESLSDALKAAQDPLEGLRRLGRAYVRFAADNQRLHRIMYREPWGERVEPVRSEIRGLIRDHMAACQDAGLVRAAAPEKFSRIGWAFMHGVAVLYLDGQVPIGDLDAMVDEAIDILLEGIAA
jgi:AcrR family transcriptional regulator